jgi:tyrocidine synthetase-3
MFVLNRLSPDGAEYNVPVLVRLEGELDVRRLRAALAALVERHACLRTSFELVGDEVCQRIKKRVLLPMPLREATSKAQLKEIHKSLMRPFDLRRAPLLRACLVRLEKTEHVLLLDMHHIVCDGASVDIMLADLGRLYEGKGLAPPARQYKDFAFWQRRFAKTADAERQAEYWLGLLGTERPVLQLPTDYPRKRDQSFEGARVMAYPGKELTAALRALAAKNRVSMYMLLLSAYYVLLSKYAGQEDIIVGTLAAGRRGEEFCDVVGLFVNTLVLRSRPRGELEFVEYLNQVRGECLSAFENQDYQFEDLVARIAPPRDLGRNPLFDTMFAALARDERSAEYGGVRFSPYELDYWISKFDLSLTAIEQGSGDVALEFEYCTALFRKETIERLSSHYLNVLEEVCGNPRTRLSDINVLTVEEKSSLVVPPSHPAEKAASRKTVVELFGAQVRRDSAAPAVSFGKDSLSYGELDRRSQALACILQEKGVARGDLVGVIAPPSIETIIAIVGVLKLGAAYLPMDPATPAERFRTIVADSGIKALLVCGDSRHFVTPGLVTIRLDEETFSCERESSALPAAGSADLAYVIYTSGSTGTHKGVMVSHEALANYVTCAVKTYFGDERISFAMHSPLSVDLTVTSIFAPLTSGGRIAIYRDDDAIGLLRKVVKDNQVDVIKLTPTHLTLLDEVLAGANREPSRIRKIIVGGEDLKTSLAAKIYTSFGGQVEIFNEYGPTEATVGCTIHRYDPESDSAPSVPIGKAIENTSVFVLDKYRNPVPRGATGELYVAGVCLASGYLNDPRLTNERFVVGRIGPAQLRMYRTGDLARMLLNGELDYLGRNDDQVKIRGFRIELGEVEANLLRLAPVKEAVVSTILDAAGDSCLCAYIVADGEFSAADLRARLSEHLPPHMIPAWFVRLERIPVARGGKLDKRALPAPPEFMAGVRPYTAPGSKAEVPIAAIWEQVLGLQMIGIDDNFFDLGGQSLKATVMTARVNRELQAGISLRDVFTHPTIREMAALVDRSADDLSLAIEPVGGREHYPASSAQKRLYILNQLAPRDVQYNVPWAIEIAGPFDAQRWEAAFRALIARHESLRTSFALVDDEIVQRVHPSADFAFERAVSNGAVSIQQEIERFVRPFDLSRAPLMRTVVVEGSPSEHTLIVDMHHIISDGISLDIILDELCRLYRGETLEPVAIQYKDYAAWQRTRSQTEALRAQGSYWAKLFEGEIPVLNLPTDFSRRAVQSFDGDVVNFQVGPETLERLRAINRECGATMYMTLLAAYTVLLSKYTGQEDIVIGTPVAGRNHASLQRVVGMFVNTLAMRNRPKGEYTFREFLSMVRSNALDAYSNQEFQFEELVEELAIERNLGRNPLFDTVFASLTDANRNFEIEGLRVKVLDFEWKISKFDLTLLSAERKQGLDFELEYCTKLFRRSRIERLGMHYKHLLTQISQRPERRIADLDLLTADERRQILIDFNRTEHPYHADRTVHKLFEEQVEKTPGAVAVVSEDLQLSYVELNRRANQIARALVSGGADREEVVGIIAGPSVEMITGMLGILKAGCAYLPIDRDCPELRVRAMLEDSGAKIVVVAGGGQLRDESRLLLDLADPGIYRGDDSNLGKPIGPRDLAYVIYTSGTTGAPKGVMIEHRSLNNLCAWHIEAFGVTAADRAAKYARFSFDASVWEIFPYLQAGAALHMIDEQIRLDLPRLNRYFEENRITIAFLPTQVCELFMEAENKSLRTLLTGGDRLRRFSPKSYQLVNNYGPTEDTVVATSGEVRAQAESIPIGKPLFNTRVYLVRDGNELVPIGVPGELCIAGVGLARGYINDSAQTTARFVPDPFTPGGRMYRTGDLAKWLPDGNIEFIGRADKQVKIRGCRTEPREIEANILAHGAVKDAVVVAREDAGHNIFLCAYIVWREAEQLADLRAYLAKQLPDYMTPAFLLTIGEIPLNARGKIDVNRLPAPDGDAVRRNHVEARSETERRLAAIWSHVLDRQAVGVHENFFEIGGDSLRATIMLARANKDFGADVALGAVFDNPSIASLARCFENIAPCESRGLKPAVRRLHYPVTLTQGLMYALCVSRKGVEYNLPMAFELRGELDVAKLEGVFRELIRRHESLRTSFRMIDGKPVQTVSPGVDFAIQVMETCRQDDLEEVSRDFIRPFDLAVPPLMRVALVPMEPGRHVMLMDIHHLVSDGTSMSILYREMAALYSGEKLPVPSSTFKDFAEWLDSHVETSTVRKQEKYWLSVMHDPPALIRLDADYPRPQNFSFAGARLTFEAEPALHAALKAFCAQRGVTMFMTLLAVYSVVLSKYSGQEDLIVALPTSGRYLAEVQDVVGMFVSTHIVRCRPQPRLRFGDFVTEVKSAVRGTLEHQEFQLWAKLLEHTVKTGSPLFSTVFVVQDQSFKTMELPGLEVREIDAGYHVAKFELTLGAVETNGKLEFELEYGTDIFRRSTLQRFSGHFLNVLEQVIADPDRQLQEIEVITKPEKEQILREFNGSATELPDNGNVVTAFERQAWETPDRVALIRAGESMTYGELNRRANQLARYLRSCGTSTGDVVAIMAPPSFAMVVGVLAVLKAGAACAPLGGNWPRKRIEHLLADTGAKLTLCDSAAGRGLVPEPLVDLGDENNYDADGSNLGVPHEAGDLALVSPVSDQTGILRAVAIEHRSLRERCRGFAELFSVVPSDRSAKYGDLEASATTFELFPFLCAGASVYILPEQIGRNAELLSRCFWEHGVTFAWLPAPLCARLADAEKTTLRVLLTSESNVDAARKGAYELVRCWGPAENSELSACFTVSCGAAARIIGRPAPGSQIYIVGRDSGLLPVGLSGELCVGGIGLAQGYLGRGHTAAERFAGSRRVDGAKMYRTGESARWLIDGNIELTRRAGEVNIDGYRVRLAEVERLLKSQTSVEDAAVVFDDAEPRRQRLIAFLVLRGLSLAEADALVQELKLHLGRWLPPYMVPDTYLQVAALPRDSDGRVQYESLPLPQRHAAAQESSAQSATARTVASMVENLLGVGSIRPEANLFDLGMNSLMAANLVAQINAAYGLALDVCQLMARPTISEVSRSLSEA